MKRRLGLISVPNWTEEEEKYLIEHGVEEASLKFNKSINSCKIKLSRLRKKK